MRIMGGGHNAEEMMEDEGGIENQPDAGENAPQENTNQPATQDGDAPANGGAAPMDKEFQVPSKPATIEEEKQIIKELEAKANLEGFKLGATWYVIASKWWKAWKDYVQYDWNTGFNRSSPGPIDNEWIIEAGDPPGEEKVKKNSMENYDFSFISEEMWKTLHAWYGGGPALPRKVISSGWHSTSLVVEVRPLVLKVAKSSSPQNYVPATFSKADTVGHFKEVMCKRFDLNPDDVRVWDYHSYSKYKLLEEMKQKLESAQIIDGQPMLLEEKGPDGKFPEIPKAKSSVSSYSYYNSGGPTDPGTTGLINLGNTCFMNSSLQCISHTDPLVQFFTSNKYRNDVNRDNPLGMKGEIAEEFANLVKELWSGSHSAVAPRNFKFKLERFAPQFAGYQQHDSQELLAFLLDGLHEDMNRIKKKPYTENPEVNDRPEEEVAKEAWQAHKARNDSVIVDYFQGQLKSTLVCPRCDRLSKTFDPFMYLSLPLPMKTTRTIYVTMCFLDPTKKPVKYGVEVVKYGNVSDLKQAIGDLSKVNPDSLVITDVYNSRFFKQFMDNENLDNIQDRDNIWAYEIMLPPDEDSEEEKENQNNARPQHGQEKGEEEEAGSLSSSNNSLSPLDDIDYYPIIHRKEEPIRHSYSSMGSYTKKSLFGLPFILSAPDASKLTYRRLYDLIYQQIHRYLKVPKGRIIRTTDDLVEAAAEEETQEPQQQTQPSATEQVADGDATTTTTSNGNASNRPTTVVEDSSEEEDSDEEEERENTQAQSQKKRKTQPLFTIRAVDSYGMSDQDILRDDDRPLRLDNRQTLVINWTEDLADQLYDEDAEKDIEIHPSCRKPTERDPEESVTLEKCLELFTMTEKLGPEDPWYCSRCQEFQQATKKFDLWKLPSILVIHLKRFSYKSRYWREKLETYVDYPIHGLDLSNYAQGPQDAPPIYDLFAVSNHYGSLGGGHYTAYGKNAQDGKWYKFDDSMVAPIDESKAKTSSAYVLFYQRRGTTAPVGTATTSETTATTTTGSSTDSSDEDNDGTNGKTEEMSDESAAGVSQQRNVALPRRATTTISSDSDDSDGESGMNDSS